MWGGRVSWGLGCIGRGVGGVLEVRKRGLGRVPDFDRVGVVADEFFEVRSERAAVGLEVGVGRGGGGGGGGLGADALGDVEDDAGEAVLVDVDFLVVGDLADFAGGKGGVNSCRARLGLGLYLTSANFSGRSQRRAPPKRGVVL